MKKKKKVILSIKCFFSDGFAAVNCHTFFLSTGKGVPEELRTADS